MQTESDEFHEFKEYLQEHGFCLKNLFEPTADSGEFRCLTLTAHNAGLLSFIQEFCLSLTVLMNGRQLSWRECRSVLERFIELFADVPGSKELFCVDQEYDNAFEAFRSDARFVPVRSALLLAVSDDHSRISHSTCLLEVCRF